MVKKTIEEIRAANAARQRRWQELHPRQENHYKNIKARLRKYGLVTHCEECGFDKCIEILQVHHIDKNRYNNALDNLQVLCRNCHAMKHLEIEIPFE